MSMGTGTGASSGEGGGPCLSASRCLRVYGGIDGAYAPQRHTQVRRPSYMPHGRLHTRRDGGRVGRVVRGREEGRPLT